MFKHNFVMFINNLVTFSIIVPVSPAAWHSASSSCQFPGEVQGVWATQALTAEELDRGPFEGATTPGAGGWARGPNFFFL